MLFIPRQPGAPIKDPKHTAAIALAAVVIAALALGPTMYFAGGFGWLDSLAYGLLIGAAVTAFLIVVGALDRAASRLFRHVFHRSSGSGASAMQAPRHPRRLLELLDEVEAGLREARRWQADPPDLRVRYTSGELTHALQAPGFELWLQCVFLPNARDAVECGSVPRSSAVGVMAMREFDGQDDEPGVARILRALSAFDVEINR